MSKERLKLEDTTLDIITKMSDGNPGAMNVIMQIISSKVDGDSIFGGLGSILQLDSFGIYGSDIYVLNNDICGRDISRTIAVLRAVQLGFFDAATLADACSRQDRSGASMVPVEELYNKVKEQLPGFNS